MSVLANKDRAELRVLTYAAFVSDPETKDILANFFKATTVTDCLVERGSIDDAIAWLTKLPRSPQRLLVDISGSTGPLDELERLANACDPSVQVFVVGDRNDIGLYRSLLQRGVQDYLVKPLGVELLRRTLTEADNAPVRQRRLGKVVVVAGTRGGVGATSVAVHLARKLAADGAHRRVVYIDLDIFGGAGTSMLGLTAGNALLELLNNASRLDSQYLERALSMVDNRLYAVGAELEYNESYTIDDTQVAQLLGVLSQYYHYVVLDVPHRGGALALKTFHHANLACIVADASIYSARTLTRLVRHIEAHPNPATVYSILNQPQPHNHNKIGVNDFVKTVESPIAVHIGYDAQTLSLAENLAEAVGKRSEFAKGIEQLANILAGETQSPERAAWWRRLFKSKST